MDGVLKNIERSAKNDWVNRKTDHFINSKLVLKDGKFISVQFFTRMWMWAVENVRDNLFNAISLVERLLQMSKNKKGLETLIKSEQITLLEVNAIGLFSVLSLRYSETAKKKCIFMAPKKSYLNCYLIRHNRGRGFGIPLKDTLSKTCHNTFFQCFAKFVQHLEFIAGHIIDNDLLSLPHRQSSHADIEQFERAIVLSSFIVCNAAAVSRSGNDMSPEEAEEESSRLPKLPLSGNICSLVKALRKSVFQVSCSTRLKKSFEKMNESSACPSLLNLMQAIGNILQESRSEEVVLFCLRQGKDEVEVQINNGFKEFNELLHIPFHEDFFGFFAEDTIKSQEFLKLSNKAAGGSDYDKISKTELQVLSKQSDERNAAMIIQRCYRSQKQEINAYLVGHFCRWKVIMNKFIKIAQECVKRKNQISQAEQRNDCSSSTGRLIIGHQLTVIIDMWENMHNHHQIFSKWNTYLRSHAPITDKIECGYCGVIFNMLARKERFDFCRTNSPWHPYYQAIRQFNMLQYNLESDQCTSEFQFHCCTPNHKQNCYNNEVHIEELSKLFVSLEVSRLMLESIICVCEAHDQVESLELFDSWYLNVFEEARSLLNKINNMHKYLWEMGSAWPPPTNFNVILNDVYGLSYISHQFFLKKQSEESQNIINASEKAKDGINIADDPMLALS